MKKLYTLRPGDTLSALAEASGASLQALLALNPQIRNANIVRSGQQIVLPDGSDRSAMLARLARETAAADEPLWLALALREENAGVREYETGSNPRIVEYLATCNGLTPARRADDDTAWCSAFANWCMIYAGKEGTDSAWALSWRNWGTTDAAPARGSLVVWERIVGDATRGHVAFLLEDRGATLFVLGGNQSNRVSRQAYPRNGMVGRTRYRNPVFRKPAGG